MTELSFYENVIPSPDRRKHLFIKVALIAAYALFLAIWIISSLLSQRSPITIFIVIAIASLALVFALRPLSVELEYSVSESQITLAKIYGKRRRKELFSAEPDSIRLIAPMSDENIKKAEAYKPATEFRALTPSTEKKRWLVVFENESEENILFIFEAEDYVSKILRILKPSAILFR